MNDKQQLVEAFLILKNATLSPQQLSDLKTYRVMSVGATGDANYVTKSINEVDADVLRKAIENDIHKISMTPNMSDENFIGNSSGVAIKYKLLPFEQNTINKQNNFEVGLAKIIELYSNFFVAMNKMSVLIDLSQINIIFKRNLPSNDFEASQMINNLSGFVSKETLISQLSFVQDADDEVEKASQESSDQSALESNQFAQDKQNNSDNSNDTNN